MDINQLIIDFLKDNKSYLITYTVTMMAYPITAVVLPNYYGKVIEDLQALKKPRFAVVIMLIILTNIMYLYMSHLDTIFIPKLQDYIRINIIQVIMDTYKDKFEEQELGALIAKIIKLPPVVRELAFEIINYVGPICLILIITIIKFTMIDKRIGALTLSGLIGGIMILIPLFKKSLDVSISADVDMDIMVENITELFDNLFDIYSMNTSKEEINKLSENQKIVSDNLKNTMKTANTCRATMDCIGVTLFFSVIAYSFHLYKLKQIELSNVVNIAVTGLYVIGDISSLSGQLPDIIINLGIYCRIQKYLYNLKPTINTNSMNSMNIATQPNSEEKGIKFDNMGVKYGKKDFVIKNFNLQIQSGESVAIVGKIGSGKSSIVKALLKFIPYEGNIYIDGVDISSMEPDFVRSKVIFIRQNPLPFNRTLYENIAYGNNNVTRLQVNDLFDKYDLHSYFHNGLDDLVGRKGEKLSGGQKMIMFLLRIVVQNDKKIVVLDEPTSSLDDETTNKILSIIKEVIQNKTTIIITHDKRVQDIVDRTIKI